MAQNVFNFRKMVFLASARTPLEMDGTLTFDCYSLGGQITLSTLHQLNQSL
jgi:hypothetical protein